VQLQLAMVAVIEAACTKRGAYLASNEAYDAYRRLCQRAQLRSLSRRAFGDLLNELDMYSFVRTRVFSRGRYGRNRDIELDLPGELVKAIKSAVFTNLDLGGCQTTLI
jgi:Cdc6-like AAA superfamily ATPase